MDPTVNGTIPILNGAAPFTTPMSAEQIIQTLAMNVTEQFVHNITNSSSSNNHSSSGQTEPFPPLTAQEMLISIFTGLFYCKVLLKVKIDKNFLNHFCYCAGTGFLVGTIGNSFIIYIVLNYTRMRTMCNV